MSKQRYQYLEAEVVESVGLTANQWAEDGWEVVSVFPRPREGFWDIISFNILFKRPMPSTENIGHLISHTERVMERQRSEYVPGKVVEHDHPLGVACGENCPVLTQWHKIAPRSPKSDG